MRSNELAIIGSVLLEPKVIDEIYETINPDMFQDTLIAEIYETILGKYDLGQPITLPSIAESLTNKLYDYEDILSVLKDCVENVVSSVEAKSHAEIINHEWKSRELDLFLANLDRSFSNIESAMSQLANKLDELQKNENKQFETLDEIDERICDNYFTDREESKITTGFSKIDECISNLKGGDLIVIGARPGVGKSAFITQVMCNMAEQGHKVGYFNLEMSSDQFYERVVSRNSGISLTRIKKAKHFLGDEKEQFKKGRLKSKLKNLFVYSGSIKVSGIKAKCRHQEFDVIVIDYLQLVRADRTFNNRASEVGEISKSIKALAMELKVPIIALSQMNRENDENSEPNISDLRESGDIEQDASIICLMWNLKNGNKGFKIGKNRQGELAKIGLEFDGNLMEFKETEFDDKASRRNEGSDNPFC